MDYKSIAISKLLSSNYSIFLPLNSASDSIVLKLEEGLKLCLIKLVGDTGNGPNVKFPNQISEFQTYDYLLAVERVTKRCWLIPISNLDLTKKSMMLTAFATEYSLVPQTLTKQVLNKIKRKKVIKEVDKVVKKEIIVSKKAVTNEDVMKLLQ